VQQKLLWAPRSKTALHTHMKAKIRAGLESPSGDKMKRQVGPARLTHEQRKTGDRENPGGENQGQSNPNLRLTADKNNQCTRTCCGRKIEQETELSGQKPAAIETTRGKRDLKREPIPSPRA
jgi:hypothetical protein